MAAGTDTIRVSRGLKSLTNAIRDIAKKIKDKLKDIINRILGKTKTKVDKNKTCNLPMRAEPLSWPTGLSDNEAPGTD